MKKHWLYLNYIVRHKWFVFVAGRKTKSPLWRLIIHDCSKFLPCEWFPYVEYFYGERSRLKEQEWDDYSFWTLAHKYYDAFDRAWLHHQHSNPHHWQHWILREDDGKTKYLDMPDHFICEMVADWMGAGRAITGRWEVEEWWTKNKGRIRLSDHTRKRVEELIDIHGEGTQS